MYTWLEQVLEEEYEQCRLLKENPRGGVFLIRHKSSGKRFILRRFTGNGEVYKKLLGYSCPNLPLIMEAAERNGENLVVEEFVEGDNLGFLLKGALFTPRETQDIVKQLCMALWVLHSMAAVHRDVKPENVILRGAGHHRLCRPGAVWAVPVRRADGYLFPGGAHQRDAHRGAPRQAAGGGASGPGGSTLHPGAPPRSGIKMFCV